MIIQYYSAEPYALRLLRKVNAYIKLDLNPYDVSLEWMEFMWSSYLYNERNLRHVTIVLNVNSPRR